MTASPSVFRRTSVRGSLIRWTDPDARLREWLVPTSEVGANDYGAAKPHADASEARPGPNSESGTL